jgi:hypothetical protein
MPSRSISGVAARFAARLSAIATSPVSRSTQRRAQRSRTQPDRRTLAEAPIKAPPQPTESTASNDALFWESLRALVVVRVGRGAKDWETVSANISFCFEQHENRRLSASDR